MQLLKKNWPFYCDLDELGGVVPARIGRHAGLEHSETLYDTYVATPRTNIKYVNTRHAIFHETDMQHSLLDRR